MSCEPTVTPDDIDIPALREKYRQERDRRLRRDGQYQINRNLQAKLRALGWPALTLEQFMDMREIEDHKVAFEKLLHDWREKGNLQGLVVSP
jgi:hypothetical protein